VCFILCSPILAHIELFQYILQESVVMIFSASLVFAYEVTKTFSDNGLRFFVFLALLATVLQIL